MSFIVAAVIFCEASICSDKERMLVASVIMNRINNPAFGGGKLRNAVDVVKQPLAFSSLHKIQETQEWIDANTGGNDIFQRCQELASGNGLSITPDIVYYHDLSIKSMPSSWNNKYYFATPVLKTEHFIFYKITKRT